MRTALLIFMSLLAPLLQAATISSDTAQIKKVPDCPGAFFITYKQGVQIKLDDGTSAHADEAFIDTRYQRCMLRGNVLVDRMGGKSFSQEVVFDLDAKQIMSTGSKKKPVETKLKISEILKK